MAQGKHVFWSCSPQRAAQEIYQAIKKKKSHLPKQYLSKGKKASEGISFNSSTASGITIELLGPVGKHLFSAMRQAMLALAKSGFNLIISARISLERIK